MAIKNNEILWITYTANNENTYCITSNKDRTYYYLYVYKDNEFIKTEHKSDNPTELEKLMYDKDVINKPINSKKKLLKESISSKTNTNMTLTKKGSLF